MNASPSADNQFVVEALESNRREGLRHTIQARTLILVILALLFVTRIPWPESGYYLIFIGAFALVGWGQLAFARANYPKMALIALMLDAVILTYMLFAPNPWTDPQWPSATIYKFNGWRYLFVFLAAATIGHSWRIILAFGAWMALVWLVTAGIVSIYGTEFPQITRQLAEVFDGGSLARILDPNRVFWSARIADAVALVLVAAILAISAWRRNQLVLAQAELSRQRSNLSRHFAPNMIEMMATRDNPFGEIRSQEVVILFADIVGFTAFAERNEPKKTIELLGRFHEQMERIIFSHEGTLDKFLGDGVMASFGTPLTRDDDSDRALRCIEEMVNVDLPDDLSVSVGAHRGTVVLGDVGSKRRLEFATIGDTVNVAARLEASTRAAGVRALVSDALVQDASTTGGFEHSGMQKLRGRKEAIDVWHLV
ncbi:MAG: adenylate/guanylate cyclase domain-containing protein [Rhizobiaceae bacterium]